MPKRRDAQENPAAEIDALRKQVADLQVFRERCREAEGALAAYEARNRLLGDSMPLGILTVDAHGRITGLNRRMRELLAWHPAIEPTPANPSACPALASHGLLDDIRRCIEHRQTLETEHQHADPQGNTAYWRYYLSPIPGADGAAAGVMAMVEDCTNLKNAEEALKESEKRYRQLFQSSPIALVEWDASPLKAYLEELRASGVTDFRSYLEGHPREVLHCWDLIRAVGHNQAFLDLMGVADGPAPGGAFLPTDSKFFMEMAREIIVVAAEGHTVNEREETLVTTSGEEKSVLAKALVVSGHEDTLARIAIALVDITQRRQAEAALQERERRFREQALRDGLTGLYNQRYLYQGLAECLERGQAHGTPVSVIFLDLDRFKDVVDTHGHLNGSRAIRLVAATIAQCIKEPAFAVAYAGDEFVVVLPGMDLAQALVKTREIRAEMKSTVYTLEEGVAVRLQATFGVATFPDHAADLNSLLAAADQALFATKKAGKDEVGVFQPS